MKKEFDIGQCFSAGWKLFKNNMSLLILSYLIVGGLSFLTFGILGGPLLVGYFGILDRVRKNDPVKPTPGDVFKGMSKFGPAFVACLLFIVVAMVASIVPVIGQIASYVVSPLLIFTLLYITFEDLSAVDAFKKVINGVTTGEMLMPVVLGILAGFVAGAGILACCVGLVFTAPFAATLYLFAYQQTKGNVIEDAEIIEDSKPTAPFDPSERDADFDDEPPTVE